VTLAGDGGADCCVSPAALPHARHLAAACLDSCVSQTNNVPLQPPLIIVPMDYT
jgi:hypothetical protein